ncbi:MAG: PTS sugar transporter subunit IIA [Burkholderiales bacterium]|jgi:PTS system nitrogen regulatory IIA component
MNTIAQLFSSKDVLLDLDVQNKQALFEAVGSMWASHRGVTANEVVDSLNAREKIGSTGLGQGVAIPHARVNGLTEAIAAFVRPKTAIQFDSPDGMPVAFCLVLLVPAPATEQHLRTLSDIASMLSSVQFRDQLGRAKNADEVHHLFATWHNTIIAKAA